MDLMLEMHESCCLAIEHATHGESDSNQDMTNNAA